MSVDHYENFPVASVLCPPRIRPAVVAIYHFARTADDLADEGDAPAPDRLHALAEMRQDLQSIYAPGGHAANPPSQRWPGVFGALAREVQRHALPLQPLADLLSAFEQDVHNPIYGSRAQVLDYCTRSANPIGRLLLHLYGVVDPLAERRADAVCTALQLINFWQDLSVDLPRGRCYLPLDDLRRHGLPTAAPWKLPDARASQRLVAELCHWAHGLMLEGAPLARQLPGRAGWELRLVVQGGLRVLEKIAAMQFRTLNHRPMLGAADVPRLGWRAITWQHSLSRQQRAWALAAPGTAAEGSA